MPPVHLVAFKLEPANREAAFTGREKELVKEWLKGQEMGKELCEQYLEYLAGDGDFGDAVDAELSTKAYWQEKVSYMIAYELINL